MPGITTPPVMIEPFAVSAAGPQITNPIPKTTATPGAASYDLGFPPDTMLPIVGGGVPPFGPDFNGILFAITASIAAMQAGQPWLYNAAIVAAIGGYPAGTVLGSSDATAGAPGGSWLSIVNANVSDPDGGSPSGWVPIYSYGQALVAGLTNANVVLTAAQAKKQFLVFSGALTANVQITLPTVFQSWLAINNCTGAFTLKLMTAGGTGVVIPAGGPSQPTPIYCDGTNIQTAVAPLSVPISVPAIASTLMERDNLGNGFVTRLNQDEGIETVSALGAVAVMNAALDGFLRFQAVSAFIARSVSGNEVTYSIAGGAIIVKIGRVAQTVGTFQAHAFAVAFPNTCDGIVTCVADSNGVEFFGVNIANSPVLTKNGFTQYSNNVCNVSYIAIGT
jgi:hypothetical protein